MPDSPYEVLIEPDAQSGDAAPSTLSFTTGIASFEPDPNAAPGPVDVSWHDSDDSSGLCLAALGTQDCFDTGQDTFFRFTPTAGHALGWLLARDGFAPPIFHLWPGECGAPRLFLQAAAAPCVTLYGLDAAGNAHSGERACAPELMSTDAGAMPLPPETSPPVEPAPQHPPDAGGAANAPSVPSPEGPPAPPNPVASPDPTAPPDAAADAAPQPPAVRAPSERPRSWCSMDAAARAYEDAGPWLALPLLLAARRRQRAQKGREAARERRAAAGGPTPPRGG